MKAARFALDRPRAAVALLCVTLALCAAWRSPAAGQTVSRRDLRAAREAVEERRWGDGLRMYERILGSGLADDPRLREEALFNTALLSLFAGPSEARPDLDLAEERLAELQKARTLGKDLEVLAIGGLFDELRREESRSLELQQALAEEREKGEKSRQQAEEALAARQSALQQARAGNRELRKKNRHQARVIKSCREEIADRDADLAEQYAYVDFLSEQLEGTHQDQAQMLEAVMRKNEELQKKERELRATRLALQQRESELEDQSNTLDAKEEELRKREEAIRAVTDRILKKDNTG